MNGRVRIALELDVDATTSLTRDNNLGKIIDELGHNAAMRVSEALTRERIDHLRYGVKVIEVKITSKSGV
jgi:hypothetical protein